jgi:hypothetical protein
LYKAKSFLASFVKRTVGVSEKAVLLLTLGIVSLARGMYISSELPVVTKFSVE